MRTRVVPVLAATVAASALTFAASPAHAATWSISGSSATGAITGHAGTTTLTDTANGIKLTCTTSDATATAPNVTGASGTNIAQVNSLSFNNCTGPLGITFTVATGPITWAINANTPITGGASGTISGVTAHLTGPGCDATVGGSVPGNVTNTTGTNATLTVLAQGSTLTMTDVNPITNCFNLVHEGDVVQFGGSYALTPNTLAVTGS